MVENLQDFEIGDGISFEHEGNIITGTAVRVNKKSLSVRTGGGNWHVYPESVMKIPVALGTDGRRINRGWTIKKKITESCDFG